MNIELLPKQIIKENLEDVILQKLAKKDFLVDNENIINISLVELSKNLRTKIFQAHVTRNSCIGMEGALLWLEKEFVGKEMADNSSNRISRLLIVSNDGSGRFYRQLTFLQEKYPNVLPILLNVNSQKIGEILSLPEKKIKAILITNKDSVCQILKSLIE